MLGIAGLFTALTGLGFGLVPALSATGRSLGALRTGSRSSTGRRGYRSLLVGVEVAASVVLLISSGLLIRAVLRVQATEPGFRSEGVLSLQTVLPKPEYFAAARRDQFYGAVLERVRAVPGVRGAAYTSGLPMVFTGGIAQVVLPGQVGEVRRDGNYNVSRRYITPQFFTALDIPLIEGRDFEDADNVEGNVAVVSEAMARRYWPNSSAVGGVFEFQTRLYTVVGVVGDILVRGLERTSEPQMYLTTSRSPDSNLAIYDPKALVIRTSGPPMALLPQVREIVRSVDPDQPISDVMTLDDLLANQTAPRRAQVRVLGALAAVALLLAGLGLHGLLAYTVAQRGREIGLRLALGENPSRIARRIILDGVRLVVLGLVPGLIIAYVAARYMSSILFGVSPGDPATIGAAVALCLVTALIGAALPTLRAVRVSPLTAMQSE
jgi:putative ABC transport system permease protein